MKNKLLFVFLVSMLLMPGCRSSYPVAQQSGLEDAAFLLFVSQKDYVKQNLTIIVDDTKFDAVAVKATKAKRKGTIYKIVPGTRHLIVQNDKGEVLYDKKVFISKQETKQIQLP